MTANCILERVPETQSTNDDLLRRWRAGELIDPVARIARKQTAGKGRVGRTWLASPEDSICFSIAFPFQRSPAKLTGLSLVVGIAVIEGIAQACQIDSSELYHSGLRLKWPNDLLLNDAKLAGVLIEGGQTKISDPTWMIIGVGINLRNAQRLQEALKTNEVKVGSLDQALGDKHCVPDTEVLWLALIESLIKHFNDFDRLGFGAYQQEWLKWDAYSNQKVMITGAGQEPQYGTAKGVDVHGALLIEQEGNKIAIYAGDVSLRIQA